MLKVANYHEGDFTNWLASLEQPSFLTIAVVWAVMSFFILKLKIDHLNVWLRRLITLPVLLPLGAFCFWAVFSALAGKVEAGAMGVLWGAALGGGVFYVWWKND